MLRRYIKRFNKFKSSKTGRRLGYAFKAATFLGSIAAARLGNPRPLSIRIASSRRFINVPRQLGVYPKHIYKYRPSSSWIRK